MRIICLHTAECHVAGFAALFKAARWDGTLEHVVRPDLLARAQAEGLEAVAQDIRDLVADARDAEATLCTCSTLGPLIDALGIQNVLRIDRPVMEQAARFDRVMLALCLESARAATVALFKDCAQKQPVVVMCPQAWPHFEAGEMAAFYRSIAQSVGQAMIDAPRTDCIVLAQASMRGAAVLLSDLGVRVLTTPQPAVQRAIDIARRNRV